MPKGSKLKGKMSSYAHFVQTCREEHKKKHPDEQVVFAEFSKKCSEKWKAMSAKEKKRFEDMAKESQGDKEGSGGRGKASKKKWTKDPNAPKRALSGFFFFCNEERPKVKVDFPDYAVGDIAKELGKRWEVCPNRQKFEDMAAQDKKRYEKEMGEYRANGGGKKGPASKKAKKKEEEEEEEEEDAKEDEKEEDGEEEDGEDGDV